MISPTVIWRFFFLGRWFGTKKYCTFRDISENWRILRKVYDINVCRLLDWPCSKNIQCPGDGQEWDEFSEFFMFENFSENQIKLDQNLRIFSLTQFFKNYVKCRFFKPLQITIPNTRWCLIAEGIYFNIHKKRKGTIEKFLFLCSVTKF